MSLHAAPEARRWPALLLALACAGAGGVIGYRLGRASADATAQAPAVAAAPAVTRVQPTLRTPPAGVPATDPVRAFVAGEASFESLVARVRNDAAWRTHLGTRLRTVGDRDERAALLALLEAAPADEALRWIAELAASGEPARRAEAWRWLATLPIEDPGVRALVQQALHAEPDPAALAVLVATLQPGLLAEEDAAPIADALLAFARGAEPRLRAAALPALSQWMHASALEGICLDALRDADHSVRGAAIAALDSAGLRPAAARGALLRIAGDRDEPPANRHAALLALAGYRLDRAEMALYRELQRELPLHPGTG